LRARLRTARLTQEFPLGKIVTPEEAEHLADRAALQELVVEATERQRVPD
jgi:hypothetical protein